jgi:creatinine amidohydrolase/Fe(II)-dependent formamide hydrolase-like protein
MSLVNKEFPSGHGSHATPSEIAITQFAYPRSIKSANYAPRIASSGPIREALDFRARHPDGRMGSDPGLATPERGEALVRMAVAGLLREIEAFSHEQAPAGQ